MLHWAPTQAAVPWFELQARAQPPQLAGLVLVFVSHPSRARSSLALQSLYPGLQAMLQTPAAQVGVPLAVLHGRPQKPQFAVVVRRSVSQPGSEVQSPYPVLQVNAQLPSVQLETCMFVGVAALHE
jgi:hypothetical protein